MVFSFKGNKRDIVHNDDETTSIISTLTQTNSHIFMLTDTLLDETSDIYLHYKNTLLVYTTEVFLVMEKKNSVYARCICSTQTPYSLVLNLIVPRVPQ